MAAPHKNKCAIYTFFCLHNTDLAMLKPAKMMNDIMFAISMYFASALKNRLLQHNEDVWSLILIGAFVAVWLRFEHAIAEYKDTLQKTRAVLSLGEEALFETIYLFSQTTVFLLVQVVVHVVDESVSEQSLWMESVILPCLMILFCVLAVTFTKRVQQQYPHRA